MSFRQFREIRLRDFRCLREQQAARLAPLTLLVGENSTGKTSLLAAVQAVWDAAHGSGDPDFNKDPFDLGAFPEIVHSRGGRTASASSFDIGFTELFPEERLVDFEMTFESRDAAPAPAAAKWRERGVSVEYRGAKSEDSICLLKSPNGTWLYDLSVGQPEFEEAHKSQFLHHLRFAATPLDLIDYLEPVPEGSRAEMSPEDLAAFRFLSNLFARSERQGPPFASGPIHPFPQRAYNPRKLKADPSGADVPSRFASLDYQDKTEWARLKKRLDEFGSASGLFDDFSVKQLTRVAGGPFQLQVRKFSKGGTKGLKRNLVDVGFGVSQVLPVLAALFRADGPSMFLLQQPELHLHPSAQAALGSLFCRTTEAGRQLIVETHSEYIVDRVRMDIRDGRTALTPDDVSILFFERADHDVRIHSLRFDERGNIVGAPDGYGQFFMDEVRRSVGL